MSHKWDSYPKKDWELGQETSPQDLNRYWTLRHDWRNENLPDMNWDEGQGAYCISQGMRHMMRKNTLKSYRGWVEGWDRPWRHLLRRLSAPFIYQCGLHKFGGQSWAAWRNSKETEHKSPCLPAFFFTVLGLPSSLWWKIFKEFLKECQTYYSACSTHISIWLWLVVACFHAQWHFLVP